MTTAVMFFLQNPHWDISMTLSWKSDTDTILILSSSGISIPIRYWYDTFLYKYRTFDTDTIVSKGSDLKRHLASSSATNTNWFGRQGTFQHSGSLIGYDIFLVFHISWFSWFFRISFAKKTKKFKKTKNNI